MSDEALIEELEKALALAEVGGNEIWLEYIMSGSKAGRQKLAAQARAILPIIRAREIEAGEKVKEAAVNMVDDLEVGWWDTYDAAVSDAYTALRALDVAAIIGGEHD